MSLKFQPSTSAVRRPSGIRQRLERKSPWLFNNAVYHPLENYFNLALRNPYVTACMFARSNWILRNGFKINTPDGVKENPETKMMLEGLFNHPIGFNKNMTYPIFHYKFCPVFILTGTGFIEIIEEQIDKLELGKLTGLDPVPYDMLDWDPSRQVWCYRINRNVYYEEDELIHLYRPHPNWKHSKYGYSPIESCKNELILMEEAFRYNYDLMKNKGLSARSVLSFDPNMDNDVFDIERDKLKAYANESNSNSVLVTKGATFSSVAQSNKDMEHIATNNISRDKILTSFRVPPHYAGVIETAHLGAGSGMTQREQMKDIARDDTIILEAAFNKVLARYGYHEVFKYEEFDTTDYLEEAQIDSMMVQAGTKTINEVRDQRGDNPVDWGYVPPQLWQLQLQQQVAQQQAAQQQIVAGGNQDMKNARNLDDFRAAKTDLVKRLDKVYYNFYGV